MHEKDWQFINTAVAALIMVVLVAGSSISNEPAPEDPQSADKVRETQPNVVFIISDDAGYGDFGFHGSTEIPTPHLDRLADSGIQFTQGYVSASVCSPSRAGLMTGRCQQRFGHEMNIPARWSEENGLPLDETTWAELMQDAGYRTVALGKWHLGYAEKFQPLQRGFDEFYGFLQGARSFWPLEKPTRMNHLRRDDEVLDEAGLFDYMTDELGERTARFIEQNSDAPFFVYLSFNAVHTPMHALESDLEGVDADLPDKRRKLIAMTKALDRNVGLVLDTIEKAGVSDNTIVIFVNDNGGATNNDSQNGVLRGTKGTPFEGGIRVPYLMRWPEKIEAGQRYDYPVSTLDLVPTCLAACEHQPQQELDLDGVNLLPYLTGESSGRPHETLFWRRGDNWAVRDGDLKLLSYKQSSPMLFDLSADQSEQNDLADSRRDEVQRLTGLYESWSSEMIPPKWNSRSNRKSSPNKKK